MKAAVADPVEQRECEALPPQTAVCVSRTITKSLKAAMTYLPTGFECEESFVYLPCNGRGCRNLWMYVSRASRFWAPHR